MNNDFLFLHPVKVVDLKKLHFQHLLQEIIRGFERTTKLVSLVIHSRGHMQGHIFYPLHQLVHREVRPQKHGAASVVSADSFQRLRFRADAKQTNAFS